MLTKRAAGGKTLKCKVCNRETGKVDFCAFHSKAYQIITNSFDVWKNAFGLSWEEYLSEIGKNSLTGEWAKEVAKYLIGNEEAKSV